MYNFKNNDGIGMKYLWEDIDTIFKEISEIKPKLLILDFDGTLAPIAKTPQKANLSQSTKILLNNLSLKPNFNICVISGRQLDDIKNKVNLSKIIYGGNHGMEIEIDGKRYYPHFDIKILQILREIKKQLSNLTNQFKGSFIEDKIFTLSFHYRSIKDNQTADMLFLSSQILNSFIKKKLITTFMGKKVIDIIPKKSFDKGNFAEFVIKKIVQRLKIKPMIFIIGDDQTDEAMFKKLNKEITIKVGQDQQSCAKYYLKDYKEVKKILSFFSSAPKLTA